jgi:hypothetical protein
LPFRSAYGFLQVNVNRNAGAPTFVPSVYNPTQVIEHVPAGTVLEFITLTDPDGDNVEMRVDTTKPKADYFVIVNNNRLALFKSLADDPDRTNTYTVYITGNDIGNPNNPSTNNATVFVNVRRNNFPPEFINAPYAGTVNRNTANGTVVGTYSVRDNDTTAPYGTVTVEIVSPSAGYAGQIFRFASVVGNTGNIIVYNDQLLAADSADTYVVSYTAFLAC